MDDPKSNVCSIYDYGYSQKAGNLGRKFKGGNAIFTEPHLPFKCPGAPQKILYLWANEWRKNNISVNLDYIKHANFVFAVPKYSQRLAKIADSYGIDIKFKHNCIEITKDTATFEHIETK